MLVASVTRLDDKCKQSVLRVSGTRLDTIDRFVSSAVGSAMGRAVSSAMISAVESVIGRSMGSFIGKG